MNILLVDDEPLNLAVLRILLEEAGHRVFEAADGVEALDVLAREPVDTVISDILMPRMDGYRLCSEIRRSERWSGVRFIFYTSTYKSDHDEKLALDLGADSFLHKPSPIATILAALGATRSDRQPAPHSLDDTGTLKEYSARLVSKLEAKNLELQEANHGLAQAEDKLREANRLLRELGKRREIVREEERARIAREIHEVLAQDLTRLKIDLVWLAKRLKRPVDEESRPTLEQRIGEATTRTDTAIDTVMRIATELRPVVLDLGLPATVEWFVSDFARRTGLACKVTATGGKSGLERERAAVVFRTLQESLNNVFRHAHATAIDIRLTEEEGQATLVVSDNGKGISDAQLADRASLGLAGMRERAAAFGGTLEIGAAPGTGTLVRLSLPVTGTPTPPSP